MKDQIKYAAKLSASAALSFVKLNLLGAVSTITVIIIEFILLSKNINVGKSGHVSALPFLGMLFLLRPVGAVIWYLTIAASPVLFFILGNKYIITKLINRIVKDKSTDLIHPLLDKLFAGFKAHQPELIKNGADYSMVKLKLMQSVKETPENKWTKRVILYGLKKAQLDGIDFTADDQNFYTILKTKIITALEDVSSPNKKPFWIIITVQWIGLLIIWLTNW